MAMHKKRSKWELLYNNFLKYEGTMTNYCAEHNIHYRTFQNWCSKLRGLNTQNGTEDLDNSNKIEQSKFIQIQLPLNEQITIKLPNGIVVEVISKNLTTIIKELVHAI